MSRYTIHTGDCREVLREYPDSHFDSIVTDPPYGLSFMGKGWDKGVPNEEFWLEALRVAKPGAYLLAFGGTRTFHRLTCAIEDAGWEIRDCVMWVYGSGFPKSHDVSKAIDKTAGITEWSETRPNPAWRAGNGPDATTSTGWAKPQRPPKPVVETAEAKQWEGWGTALKPAWEPIIVARKPLDGTVAANVLKYGTGAINIDGCRVETSKQVPASPRHGQDRIFGVYGAQDGSESGHNPNIGRWPANLITDGSEEVVAGFPESKDGVANPNSTGKGWHGQSVGGKAHSGFGGSGSAARFFYCAKTSSADREEGNTHPTVKPTALMKYLCRLVTQPNGLVLDPFCGSGSTGKAALLEGFRFVGIDLDTTHTTIANARCEHAAKKSNTESLTGTEDGDAIQLSILDGL